MAETGQNLFAVDAVNNLPDNSPPNLTNASPETYNPAGFLFYARLRSVETGRKKTNDFASDSSWVCSNQKHANWQKPEFAVEKWSHAIKLAKRECCPGVHKGLHKHQAGCCLSRKGPRLAGFRGRVDDALDGPIANKSSPRGCSGYHLASAGDDQWRTLADILKRAADNLLADPAATQAN